MHSVREYSIGVNPIPLWDYADMIVTSEAVFVGMKGESGGRGGQAGSGRPGACLAGIQSIRFCLIA